MTYTLTWLKERFDKEEPLEYIFFWGHANKSNEKIGKFVLSQWYPSPFTVDGVTYKTAEHWMMAHKAKLFHEMDIFEKIVAATKPGEAKDLGRQIRNFDEAKWSNEKFQVVKTGSIHKFSQHKELGDFLMASGNKILVEASPTDFVWGIGMSQDSKMIRNPHAWRGENLLGFALMEARDFLRDFKR